MHNLMELESTMLRDNLPTFRVGDTVKMHMRITEEGGKERIQVFEGVAIRRTRRGVRSTVTVRKISYGIGVERILPLHSPNVAKMEVVKSAHVRQARLYFLRDLRGKAARLKPRRRNLEITGWALKGKGKKS